MSPSVVGFGVGCLPVSPCSCTTSRGARCSRAQWRGQSSRGRSPGARCTSSQGSSAFTTPPMCVKKARTHAPGQVRVNIKPFGGIGIEPFLWGFLRSAQPTPPSTLKTLSAPGRLVYAHDEPAYHRGLQRHALRALRRHLPRARGPAHGLRAGAPTHSSSLTKGSGCTPRPL